MSIRRFKVKQRNRIDKSNDLRVVVEGDVGNFDAYFPLFKRDFNSADNPFPLKSGVLDINIYPHLRKNKKTHKAELGVKLNIEQSEWIISNFKSTGEVGRIAMSFVKRINIISGLALTASIPGTTMKIYDRVLNTHNVFYEIRHGNLSTLLDIKGQLAIESEFEERYEKYFNYFWFNYDRSITKHDELLLKGTLKLM